MKNPSNYQQVKNALKNVAKEAKQKHPTDKPLIRMTINNYVNYLAREYNITEYQVKLLSSYSCSLHPRD